MRKLVKNLESLSSAVAPRARPSGPDPKRRRFVLIPRSILSTFLWEPSDEHSRAIAELASCESIATSAQPQQHITKLLLFNMHDECLVVVLQKVDKTQVPEVYVVLP